MVADGNSSATESIVQEKKTTMDTRFGKLLVRPVDDGLLDENNSKFPNDPFQLFATPSNPVSARQSAHGTTCECWPSSPEAPLALTST